MAQRDTEKVVLEAVDHLDTLAGAGFRVRVENYREDLLDEWTIAINADLIQDIAAERRQAGQFETGGILGSRPQEGVCCRAFCAAARQYLGDLGLRARRRRDPPNA
jgi:hypothetical protein